MKVNIKTSYILSFLLSFLLICLSQSHVNAQDFLKKFLSNSLIKSGKQLKSDGDYPSAITAFTKSIKRESENLEAYYQLGLIFEEVLRDYDKAISLYKNVIRLSEGIKPVGTDEELKVFNSLITSARTSIDRNLNL
ncbi:MAG: tetratricopeptide repeat protein [Candidatus Scalindua sp.]